MTEESPAAAKPYVLIVDDDPDALTISQLTLEWAGVPVRVASSASEALRMALAEPPVVAVIDLNMPEMSGVDLLRTLRADDRTARITAVALTGVPEMLDSVTDVQFDSVLVKPVAPEKLGRIVRSLLGTPELT